MKTPRIFLLILMNGKYTPILCEGGGEILVLAATVTTLRSRFLERGGL